MEKSGRIWKYGDNVNTDLIFPGKYTYSVMIPEDMGRHALEALDPRFAENVLPGDVVVAGNNWGGGSSREQAVKCLKARKIAGVVAKSFSRIYFRNAINIGLAAIVCPECVDEIADGDPVSLDIANGEIRSLERIWKFPFLPEFLRVILDADGLLPYIAREKAI